MNIVTHDEWARQRTELLAKEKEFTRLRDELATRIQAMPWESVEKEYTFEGPTGRTSLAELFGTRSQLIVYHFMFGPDWEAGCKSCSLVMDHIAPSAVHIEQRDVAFAVVSRAPLAKLAAFQERMGWEVNWVSSLESDFNDDFHVSVTEARAEAGDFEYNYAPSSAPAGSELPGLSVFAKDAEGRIFHTYSTYTRGLDTFMGVYRLLDIVPRGRNEEGLAYGMEWVRHHDSYGDS